MIRARSISASPDRHKPSSRLAEEDGFMLVEVLVSALILVGIILAGLTALDNFDRLAGNQGARNAASNLAQADLERVKALPVEDYINVRSTRTVSVEGREYSITTKSIWIADGVDSGDECLSNNKGKNYVQVQSTVNWDGGRPVRMTTLVTPPAGSGASTMGSFSASFTDRDGNPVVGLPVSISGPASYSDVTNSAGCVAWGFLPQGTGYKVSFSKSGFVDRNGRSAINDSVVISAKTHTAFEYNYDAGGNLGVQFVSRRDGVEYQSRPTQYTINNGGLTNPLIRNLSGSVSSDNFGPLFPFNDPYGIYAGGCVAAAPPSPTVAIVPRGGTASGIKVLLPGLDVRVFTGTGPVLPVGNASNAQVTVTDACGNRTTRATTTAGLLADTGFPYFTAGKGLICVAWNGRYVALPGTQALTVSNSVTNGNDTDVNVYMNGLGSTTSKPASCA